MPIPLIAQLGLQSHILHGETVIVTGGGSGIGFEAARALLWLGANVVIAEINTAKGELAAEKLAAEFDYVTSEAYIDKILKQNKGLINPGEEVIIVTSNDSQLGEEDDLNLETISKRDLEKLSNTEKWRIFIFEDNPFR